MRRNQENTKRKLLEARSLRQNSKLETGNFLIHPDVCICMLQVTKTEFSGVELKKARDMPPTQIDSTVSIANVRQMSTTSVLLEFVYTVNYLPNIATFNIYGQAVCFDTKENIQDVLDQYKREATVSTKLVGDAINIINANAALNSIFVIRPFGLVPPFAPPPPIVNAQGTGAVPKISKITRGKANSSAKSKK